MAEAARRRGYAYQVLTDHSPVARHRPRPDARTGSRSRREIIAALNARFAAEEAAGTAPPETPPEGFRLLHGCELEVRADGALDYEDDLLARFDLVVASVHVSRRQPRAELTRRTLNAIRSPHVDVIAHPSGRKIGQRDDLDLDWDAVYAEAARTGTALEMNGSPPPARPRRRARPARGRRSAACCRSTRTRTTSSELDYVRWGISQARRAWVDAGGRPQHPVAGGPPGLGRRQAGAADRDRALAYASRRWTTARPAATSRSSRSPSSGCRACSSRRSSGCVAGALLGAMLLGTLQVLADEAAPAHGLVRRPDRVAHPAGGRGGRLPRRDPARAVRAVARAGARRHVAARRPHARPRGADQPRSDRR